MGFLRLDTALFSLFLIGIVSMRSVNGQEIRFSQYQATPVYVNPAMAGATPNPVIHLNTRLQQFGAVSYSTGFASLALPLFLSEREDLATGGIAMNFLQDVAGQSGEFRTTAAQLAASYNVYLNRYGTQFLSFGIMTGYRQTQIDFSSLQWPSQLRYNGFTGDQLSAGAYSDRLGVFGIHAGLLWMYDPARNPLQEVSPMRLFAGISLSHLNEPPFDLVSSSDNTLSKIYQAQAGGRFLLNPRWHLSPDMLAVWQGELFTYQIGMALSYHTEYSTPSSPVPTSLRLLAGTWYREEEALVFMVGLGGKKWQAAVSYDANTASVRRGIPNQYAMEVSLQYQWFTKKDPKTQSTPLF